MKTPPVLLNKKYRYDSFSDGKLLPEKRPGHLPAMGWNSWNAFGHDNNEELTLAQAEKFLELGLKDLGYEYIVLDDGCYRQERVDGRLACETLKFPSGFKGLADKLHAMGLKFGMYNDIGTNLCGGAAVGTCGFEDVDAESYKEWDIDYIKVDNCYYPWDNATFAAAENARFSWAPAIKAVSLSGHGFEKELGAVRDGRLEGDGAVIVESGNTPDAGKNGSTEKVVTGDVDGKDVGDAYVTRLGTKDGPGPYDTPHGPQSSELIIDVTVPEDGKYDLKVLYATAKEEGTGEWLQVGVGSEIFYDDLLPETTTECSDAKTSGDIANGGDNEKSANGEKKEAALTFVWSDVIGIGLKAGKNSIRIMNHRRQENPHHSYAVFLECLREAVGERDVRLSVCEWGKNQPQNWAYRVGDSWRILNDITFNVGTDGTPGTCGWVSDYTTSITAQYNKAVVMDSFASKEKGWNDPDMLALGMTGLDETMNRTHFSMWCMMNSPLMLGLDLRKVNKGDFLCDVITNRDIIALNQDPLGIQAKRVFTTYKGKGTGNTAFEGSDRPDVMFITDNDRIDVLAKPLADGSLAVAFYNLSENESGEVRVDFSEIKKMLAPLSDALRKESEHGSGTFDTEAFFSAGKYEARDLWTGEKVSFNDGYVAANAIPAHGDVVYKITI